MTFLKRWGSHLKTFYQLLRADFAVLKSDFLGDLIDGGVWVVCDMTFCAYVMPIIGVPSWYGFFIAAGIISSLGLFDCYNVISDLVADYEGSRVVLFPLVLPLPAWMVFFKLALVRALRTLAIGFLLMPLVFIILVPKNINFVPSIPKFFLASILNVLLAGMFGVWASSLPKNSATVGRVTTRILLPLWVFGGLWASWKTFNTALPYLAKLLLLNPFLHGSEVLRVSVMGQRDFLPYWWSMLALAAFISILGVWGVKRLKKRLDFV
ncbi:hypothetical protein KAU11_02160 [Candidatus Babeliales bacterium]|nr:hypothetical protein [Candidatus Babeliales bacterium]